MADITMPQLGETVTEGTITKWYKEIGDRVEEDEVLYEVSTDKVDSEVPSPAAGYLAEIKVNEGETVDVGEVLAVLSDEPPGEGGASSAEEDAPEEEAAPEDEPEAEEEPAAEEEATTTEEEEPKPEPAPKPDDAEAEKPEPKPEAKPKAKPKAKAKGKAEAKDTAKDTDARLLSPVVRRLIAENDLDPDEIEGTGAGGRITRNDVLEHLDSRGQEPEGKQPAQKEAAEKEPAEERPTKEEPAKKEAAQRPAAKAAAADAGSVPEAGEDDEVVPFTNIRRRTAEHMVRSKATSPHVLTAIEVDFERVEQVRQANKAEWREEEGFGLTYLPFISRAVVDALHEFPHLNASVGDDELIVHRYVNLGFAVDLDHEGLIVPVVQDADGKRLRAIAREVSDLADRARNKKLSADEIVGGTFTITNPGPYGTFISAPVINQPQVAILSTEGIKRRPVVVELADGSEAIAVHSVGYLAMSWDHRAVDGAYASAFLAKLKEILETREWEAELA